MDAEISIEELRKLPSITIGKESQRKMPKGQREKIEDLIRVSTQKNRRDGEQEEVYVGINVAGSHPWLVEDGIRVEVFPDRPRMFVLERTTPDDTEGHRMRKSDNPKRHHFHFTYRPEFPRTDKLTAVKIVEETPDCILCEVPEES